MPFNEALQSFFSSAPARSVIIVLIAFIADRILNRRLLKFISRRTREENAVRYKTLLSVLSKIVSVVIAFIAVLSVLQILFGVNPASLVAATGIAGAAVGLGAQSLVKDSINGFFILIEDQFSVGDHVTIEGFEGRIRSVSLRMTCVESFEGDCMYIPNSAITKVINHSREDRTVFLDIPVSYDADIGSAMTALDEIAAGLKDKFDYITDTPAVLGVGSLDGSAVSVKIKVPCAVGQQFQCKRDALKVFREEMAARDIEIPYSHITVIHKEEQHDG